MELSVEWLWVSLRRLDSDSESPLLLPPHGPSLHHSDCSPPADMHGCAQQGRKEENEFMASACVYYLTCREFFLQESKYKLTLFVLSISPLFLRTDFFAAGVKIGNKDNRANFLRFACSTN